MCLELSYELCDELLSIFDMLKAEFKMFRVEV